MRLGLRYTQRRRFSNTRTRTRALALSLSLGALGACMGTIETADERKIVYELTTGELTVLCTWLDDAIAVDDTASDEELCELQAAQSAADATQCYEARSTCLNSTDDGRYVAGRACQKSGVRPPRQCEATVAQVKSCFLARERELVKAAQAASCGDVHGSKLPDATLVSCRDVTAGCQALFGTLGSSEMAIEMAPVKN